MIISSLQDAGSHVYRRKLSLQVYQLNKLGNSPKMSTYRHNVITVWRNRAKMLIMGSKATAILIDFICSGIATYTFLVWSNYWSINTRLVNIRTHYDFDYRESILVPLNKHNSIKMPYRDSFELEEMANTIIIIVFLILE